MSENVNPETTHELEHAKRYLLKIWASRGSRFVANRRLQRKSHASQMVLSLFAVAVIAAGVWLLIISPEQKRLADFISVLAIDASVFILVLSNLEFSKNYAVTADRMLKGAQALSPLHDELEMTIRCGKITPEGMQDVIKRYNEIINEFEVQHEDIDFIYFQSMHPHKFHLTGIQGMLKRLDYRIRYFLYIWGLYIVCVVVPPLLIAGGMYGFPSLPASIR